MVVIDELIYRYITSLMRRMRKLMKKLLTLKT